LNAVAAPAAQAGSWTSQPEHTGELIRLNRLLEGAAGRFALIVAQYNQPAYRDHLIESLGTPTPNTALDANTLPDFITFESYLETHGGEPGPLHLTGLDRWLHYDAEHPEGLERLQAFNLHRDWIAKLCRRPLVLWLLEHQVREFARQAPDAWEWRAGMLDFSVRFEPSGLALPEPVDHGSAPREERLLRIGEIREFLDCHDAELSERERGVLWDELGELYQDIGEWKQALDAFKNDYAACARMDDRRGTAQARAKMSFILWMCGDLDQALDELNAALAVFDSLGDLRSKAVTQGKIADILHARGQLDEALRIQVEEELPVYERLGDVRSKAVTQGKIADILEARGQLDEALRIRVEEQLPVYERLGDMRAKAVTQGKIADILQTQGQLGEALRTYEELSPHFEQLGEVRFKAITQGKIADILRKRGQLDEALRIHIEEELPVYERLGDMRSKAMTLGQIADILHMHGQLDNALRIRVEEELPVYEQLGDVRAKSVALFKIAQAELEREQYKQAFGRLREAYEIAEKLKIPDGLAAVGELYGQLLFHVGEREQGLAVLETARDTASRLGWDKNVETLQDLIGQLRNTADTGQETKLNPAAS
jgi:tetratricopeptide (TPR) repeat protein